MELPESAEIEVLSLDNLSELVAIMEAVQRRPLAPIGGLWTKDALKQELKVGQGIGLRVAGFGLAAFVLFRMQEQHREVTVLATHPDRQRRGDMQYLLSYVLERRSPNERIWLEVHASNSPAMALYSRLGFQSVGRRAAYYRDGGDAILMSL